MTAAKPIRVLCIEDSVDDEQLVLMELRSGGYQVEHERVETKEAMLAAIERTPWDVILSDYSMPQFSGPEALAIVNRLELDVPFIIVSGTVGEDIAVDAMRFGASDYVLKDNLVRLCPAIERELREAQIRKNQREAENARRAIEARFRAIMETATDGVISADGGGTITYSNPGAERLFGFQPGELLGERVSSLVPERFMDAQRDQFLEDLEREQRGVGRTIEIFGRRKDGSEFPMDLSLGSWMAGSERFFACIVRDVSERKQVEAQLLAADRMISVGTLAAGVAHEINNPLAAVMGNLDISVSDLESLSALPRPDAVSALREQLVDARDAAARVRNIVRDLRIFSRADDEKRAPVDVKVVLDSTLRIAWNEIRHRAQLVKDYADVPRVEANEGRLGQVFLNLLVNAAQAIGEGKADENEIRVATRTDATGRVVVEISDTGPGIPPAVMKRLFSPFVTTKPAGTGTGLGLSICHRIVHELGGTIEATTEPGKGTTFRVTLPLATTDADSFRPPAEAERRALRRGRILVVDDEPMIAGVVQRSLSPEHDVVAVDRPREALDLIRAGERFDVILCDLMMPDVTGMDFHAQLTKLAPEHASAVLFLTGGAFTPSARDFLDAVPASRRIEKPFDVSHLRAVINDRVR